MLWVEWESAGGTPRGPESASITRPNERSQGILSVTFPRHLAWLAQVCIVATVGRSVESRVRGEGCGGEGVALHAETSEVYVENLVTGESFANKPSATARSVGVGVVRRGGTQRSQSSNLNSQPSPSCDGAGHC